LLGFFLPKTKCPLQWNSTFISFVVWKTIVTTSSNYSDFCETQSHNPQKILTLVLWIWKSP
jgi:hypothetical protein